MAGELLERLCLARVHKVLGSQRPGVSFLCRGGRERRDLGTKGVGELHRHVTQATDADDTYPRRWIDPMGADRVVDSDTAAQQWRSPLAIHALGYRYDEACVDADPLGITAVAVNAGAL